MASYGGGGDPINSVIEAQARARELGSPWSPDAAEEEAEAKSRRAGWVVAGLVLVGATWFVAGLSAAATVFGVIAAAVLAAWWIRSR